MDHLAGRHLALDGVEKLDKLLMPVTWHATAGDRAFQHIQGSEQRRRPVAFVVMRHGSGLAGLERQAGLGAVERLDLALLVDREHDGMARWFEIEADDVAQLLGELRVLRELERAQAMGLQLVIGPDALHRGQRDADLPGHHPSRPMGRRTGWLRHGQLDHPANDILAERRPAGRAGPVAQQPIDPLLGKTLLPTPDSGAADTDLTRDGLHIEPPCRREHDARTPDMLLRGVAIADDPLQPLTVIVRQPNADFLSHPRRLA